jgi:hypothetical protein
LPLFRLAFHQCQLRSQYFVQLIIESDAELNESASAQSQSIQQTPTARKQPPDIVECTGLLVFERFNDKTEEENGAMLNPVTQMFAMVGRHALMKRCAIGRVPTELARLAFAREGEPIVLLSNAGWRCCKKESLQKRD